MRSALKSRDVHVELAEQFLRLVRSKGISNRPISSANLNRKAVKHDLAEGIASLISKLGLKVPTVSNSKEQLVFSLGVRPRHVNLPMCREVVDVRTKRYPRLRSRKRRIFSDEIDTLTVCFACFFVREGFSGQMRWRESLDPLRELVVSTLVVLGYFPQHEESRPRFRIWPKVSNWGCLANKDGALHEEISRSEELARKIA